MCEFGVVQYPTGLLSLGERENIRQRMQRQPFGERLKPPAREVCFRTASITFSFPVAPHLRCYGDCANVPGYAGTPGASAVAWQRTNRGGISRSRRPGAAKFPPEV